MEPAMKIEDDCSNCINHEQGNFNRPPCDTCLDSTSTFGSVRYPNWKAKPSKVVFDPAAILKKDLGVALAKASDASIMADAINPSHYTNGGIETIDFMKAKLTPEEYRGYLRGCALKYLSRLGNKDAPVQEASKAMWYVAKLIEDLR